MISKLQRRRLRKHQKPRYWASGTGYGNDSMTGDEWNVNAYIDTQSKQSDAAQTALKKIKGLLNDLKSVPELEDRTSRDIEKFLIPVIEYYLFDVSFLDLDKFVSRYVTLFEILEALAPRTQIQSFLFPQKDRTKCIYSIVKSLKSQTKLMVLEKKKKDESDFLIDFTKKVNHLFDVLKEIKNRSSLPSDDTNTSSSVTSSSSTTETETEQPASRFQILWRAVTCQQCRRKKDGKKKSRNSPSFRCNGN